jgi:hypothetical protein
LGIGTGSNSGLAKDLRLVFQLPGSEIPLDASGSIVYQQPEEGFFRCGVNFDWGQNRKFTTEAAAIAKYVAGRQTESWTERGNDRH